MNCTQFKKAKNMCESQDETNMSDIVVIALTDFKTLEQPSLYLNPVSSRL